MILCSSAECVDHTSAILRVLLLKQHHTKHFGCDFPDLPSSLELEYLSVLGRAEGGGSGKPGFKYPVLLETQESPTGLV